MVRRTCAPSLVWFCTFHRKMSPTLMCTRSRSLQSSSLCVPLPLPWTPMMTYLRMMFLLLRSVPAVVGAQPRGHPFETVLVEDRALAADAVLVDLEDPVQPDPTGPPLAIPVTRSEPEPVALAVPLTPAGQHQAQESTAVAADHQHGAVLALVRVVLVADPGPHDLAGIGLAIEIRCVLQVPPARRGRHLARRRRRPTATERAAQRAGDAVQDGGHW